MSIVEAIIIGIIQGLTEFLPVSSSGHIELSKVLLEVETKENLLFSVVVHAATALATIIIFAGDIRMILTDFLTFKKNENSSFGWKILLSTVPVLIVGLFLKDPLEGLFNGNVLLVSAMLLVTGALLAFTYYAGFPKGKINYPKALIIGLAQAVAVLPGISRSGATISTAILLGVERKEAARFSFLMVLIPIIGATLLELKDYLEVGASSDISIATLVIGFLAAFLSGLVACRWMMAIVRKGKLIYFAVYCLLIGAAGISYTILF